MIGRPPLRTDIQPGQRFGTRVVIRHVPRAEAITEGRRSGYWLLRCDCGKDCRLQANQIGMSNRLSCGCDGNASGKRGRKAGVGRLDVTGMRFGILTAIRCTGSSKQGALWAFRCDCGKEAVKRLKDVRHGTTSSCGCLRPRTAANQAAILNINRPWRAAEHVDQRWLVLTGECSPVGAATTDTQSPTPPA